MEGEKYRRKMQIKVVGKKYTNNQTTTLCTKNAKMRSWQKKKKQNGQLENQQSNKLKNISYNHKTRCGL